MYYISHLVVLIAIFSVLGLSLNLLAGYTGLLSICHAAFFGIGAYATALLLSNTSLSWLVTVLVGMVLSALIAFVLGAASLRLRNEQFVIASFAFQIIILSVMLNWTEVTHGPLGLTRIPRPEILGWRISSGWGFALLSLILLGLTLVVTSRLVNSPYGRVLQAIREDEVFVQSLGKNVFAFKLKTFMVAAAIASVAGSLYASYVTYVDPTSFTLNESVFILAIVIIGGAGSRYGPLIGAIFLVLLPEALRFAGLPSPVAANLRQIIYGAALVLAMLYRPNGLVGHYGFGK